VSKDKTFTTTKILHVPGDCAINLPEGVEASAEYLNMLNCIKGVVDDKSVNTVEGIRSKVKSFLDRDEL